MWFYRLVLLLALIATWIPRESKSFSFNAYEQGTHHVAPIFIDREEPEEQEDDEGEELAA